MRNAPEVLQSALVRGLYNALGVAFVTFLVIYGPTDDLRLALISAGVAGLGALGFRAGGEGGYDAHRAAVGRIQRGDVAAYAKPLPNPHGEPPNPPDADPHQIEPAATLPMAPPRTPLR